MPACEVNQRKHAMSGIILLILMLVGAGDANAQAALPLKHVQTIPMPGVVGRLDHLGVDIEGGRLFVAALGASQNTVEVIDLKAGKRISSIRGQSMPQGVFYSSEFKKLFVANGRDGTVKSFSGDNFTLLDSLSVGAGADHVGYDPVSKYLYVGASNPNSRAGALAVIDTRTGKQIGAIQTDSRPGGIKIEKSGPRIFVTLGGLPKVGVVDREKRQEAATWPLTGVPGVIALAFDEAHHRLFGDAGRP
jgi:DNA-binding beta-propeller fold protein YncE